MEYLWGYAAANAPLSSVYNQRKKSNSNNTSNNNSGASSSSAGGDNNSRPTPSRSNSAKIGPSTLKKSRFPGHRRTTSSSSSSARSRSSHEIPSLQRPVGAVGGSAAAGALSPPRPSLDPGRGPPPPGPDLVPGQTEPSERDHERMPASVRYQNKQLPAAPRLPEFSSASFSASLLEASTASASSSSSTSTPTPALAPTPSSSTTSTTATRYHSNTSDSSNVSAASAALSAGPGAAAFAAAAAASFSAAPPPAPPTPSSPKAGSGPAATFAAASPYKFSAAGVTLPYASSFILPDRRLPLHQHHAAMLPEPGALNKLSSGSVPFGRSESLSSNSGATTLSTRTMMSSEPPSSAEGTSSSAASSPFYQKPFINRNGRTYLSDTTLPYPLPVDLPELHRQTLRTLLLFQLFNAPICSPSFGASKPPTRVLEVGCGSGFWSIMCHRWFVSHGHSCISFTGVDVAPIGFGPNNSGSSISRKSSTISATSSGGGAGAGGSSGADGTGGPDKDMRWRFVRHDMRRLPWPFPDEEFDLIMVKDMSLATTTEMLQPMMDEYLRMLRPGGTIEIWESDHHIRMLRPHVPGPASSANDGDEEDEREAAADMGAYVMTANTPLSAPLNNFLVEYNGWLTKALEARSLSPVPCTLVGPLLLQEAEDLVGVGSRRLAVPLSEVKWEREGVGGVVTKDGKSYIETGKGKGRDNGQQDQQQGRKALTAGQSALRRTALHTVVQLIQSLEPLLREVSGKSQDEWDGWTGKMMNDLMKDNGTSWGECLEVGAWWARKRK